MQIRNSVDRYGAVAQLLHWAVVALIITQVVLAEMAEDAPSLLEKAKLLTTHKSVGMTVFMLAIVRLTWRFINPTPAAPPGTPSWQSKVSAIMHGLLYALIFLTPLFGWLMSSAKSYSVSYFGLFTFPNLVEPNDALFEQFEELHEIAAKSMVVLAMLHALAALKHHIIDKDNVLRRMLPLKLK